MITSGPNLGCLCGSSQILHAILNVPSFLGCLFGSSQYVDNANVLICILNSELNVPIPNFRLIGNLLSYRFKYRLSGKMVEMLVDNSGTEPL